MRSFAGRDILSLKDFEREEFFHVFEVADEMAPSPRAAGIPTCWQRKHW